MIRVGGIKLQPIVVAEASNRGGRLLVRDELAMIDIAANKQSHAPRKSPTKWIPGHKNFGSKNRRKNMIDAACGRLRNKN